MAGEGCISGGVHGRSHVWQGACMAGGILDRGHAWWGACMMGGKSAGETVTEAGSRHPTGMHSCFHVKSH